MFLLAQASEQISTQTTGGIYSQLTLANIIAFLAFIVSIISIVYSYKTTIKINKSSFKLIDKWKGDLVEIVAVLFGLHQKSAYNSTIASQLTSAPTQEIDFSFELNHISQFILSPSYHFLLSFIGSIKNDEDINQKYTSLDFEIEFQKILVNLNMFVNENNKISITNIQRLKVIQEDSLIKVLKIIRKIINQKEKELEDFYDKTSTSNMVNLMFDNLFMSVIDGQRIVNVSNKNLQMIEPFINYLYSKKNKINDPTITLYKAYFDRDVKKLVESFENGVSVDFSDDQIQKIKDKYSNEFKDFLKLCNR